MFVALGVGVDVSRVVGASVLDGCTELVGLGVGVPVAVGVLDRLGVGVNVVPIVGAGVSVCCGPAVAVGEGVALGTPTTRTRGRYTLPSKGRSVCVGVGVALSSLRAAFQSPSTGGVMEISPHRAME